MTDEVFSAAVALVLSHEGGYVCDAADPGGETNFGICRRSYPAEDIKGMTRERAKAIYFSDYWLRYRFNRLPGVAIPVKVFDAAVNVGPETAIKYLQRAIVECGTPCLVDGVIGPGTVLALSKSDPAKVLGSFKAILAGHYRAIVARDPTQVRFLSGWLNRVVA